MGEDVWIALGVPLITGATGLLGGLIPLLLQLIREREARKDQRLEDRRREASEIVKDVLDAFRNLAEAESAAEARLFAVSAARSSGELSGEGDPYSDDEYVRLSREKFKAALAMGLPLARVAALDPELEERVRGIVSPGPSDRSERQLQEQFVEAQRELQALPRQIWDGRVQLGSETEATIEGAQKRRGPRVRVSEDRRALRGDA